MQRLLSKVDNLELNTDRTNFSDKTKKVQFINKSHLEPRTYPGYQRFFSRAAENFQCGLKADTSSAVGRSHEHTQVTIKTRQKPETALEKSLAPRVPRT